MFYWIFFNLTNRLYTYQQILQSYLSVSLELFTFNVSYDSNGMKRKKMIDADEFQNTKITVTVGTGPSAGWFGSYRLAHCKLDSLSAFLVWSRCCCSRHPARSFRYRHFLVDVLEWRMWCGVGVHLWPIRPWYDRCTLVPPASQRPIGRCLAVCIQRAAAAQPPTWKLWHYWLTAWLDFCRMASLWHLVFVAQFLLWFHCSHPNGMWVHLWI